MLFKNITVVGEGYAVSDNMYLQTVGEKIAYIGKDLPPNSDSDEAYDGTGKVILPGFINTHSHLPMSLMRGYGEGLPLQDWLFNKVFPFEDLLTDEDCYWGTLMSACEMLRSGVTSTTDMYMFISGVWRGISQSGLKANIATSFADIDILKALVQGDKSGRFKAEYLIHSEYTTTPEVVENVTAACKADGFGLQVHLSETLLEHQGCIERHGMTPTQYFNKMGTFDNRTTAAHGVFVTDDDMEILAQKGVTVAHCPTSNLKLGSGVAPVMRMLERGVNVGIGTDGASGTNHQNMLEGITLASLMQKGTNNAPLALSCVELLTMACKNGAKSQGRTDCGEIKVGNKADMIVFDLNAPHIQPIYEVLPAIFHSAQASDIVLNMVDGKVLYKDGVYTTIDVEQVIFNCGRIKNEKLAALR